MSNKNIIDNLIIEKNNEGYLIVSCLVKNTLICEPPYYYNKCYLYYTKKEAIKLFIEDLKSKRLEVVE